MPERPDPRRLAMPALIIPLLTVGCGPGYGGDDDDTATPSEAATTETATPTAGLVTVTGKIVIKDASTGEQVAPEVYDACFGPIAVYLMDDPARLDEPLEKRIMDEPGTFQFVLPPRATNFYMTVMADTWANNMLDFRDLFVEYAHNPVSTDVADMDLNPVELAVGLCNGTCCSGGGGSATYSSYAGTVHQDPAVPVFPIMVTANNTDFLGPYSADLLYTPGDFLMYVNEAYLDQTSLMAIVDIDNNGLFEPSDHLGVADQNPYPVGGQQAVTGIDILIDKKSVKLDAPYLPVYVPVTGTIQYEGPQPQGLIYVAVSRDRPRGPLVSEGALPEASPFLLRAPQNTANMWVWGVVDENGDGIFDPATEAWGKVGPVSTTKEGVFGLTLKLGDEAPVTPSPEPTDPPEATEAPAPTPAPTPIPATEPPAATEAPGGESTPGPAVTPPEVTSAPTAPVVEPPTPTAAPSADKARIAGSIRYGGSVTTQDVLVVAIEPVTQGEASESAVMRIPVTAAGFPIPYSAGELPPDTYQILAYVDKGGNNMNGPGQEDDSGWYTGTDGPGAPAQVTVSGGDDREGMDFEIYP